MAKNSLVNLFSIPPTDFGDFRTLTVICSAKTETAQILPCVEEWAFPFFECADQRGPIFPILTFFISRALRNKSSVACAGLCWHLVGHSKK